MPPLRESRKRYRDHESPDTESQSSDIPESDEEIVAPSPTPKWYRGGRSKAGGIVVKIRELRSHFGSNDPEERARKSTLWRKLFITFLILAFFGAIAAITYISLVAALIHRLNPPKGSSGLQYIVENWREPDSNGAFTFEWRDDFSRDIVPKNCHSHNDYWRSVPLFEALAAGCISIEADIWLNDVNELLVSHSWKSTKQERTLRSLYLDPLTNILTNRNVSVASTEEKEVGVFDTDPNVSTILLVDFKNDGDAIWPVLLEQLQPLREKGWLTYFDGDKLVQGPLTIVGTGNTPFDLVKENNTDRFIFFDAPLDDISNLAYTSENSYYASVQLSKAIGRLWLGQLTSNQIETLKSQIKAASDKGLKSRYWDTPSWPISLRDMMWFKLTELEVDMLNVDDLVSATRWNWNWCVIAGLNLCGH